MNEQQINILIDSLATQIGRQAVTIAQLEAELTIVRQQLAEKDQQPVDEVKGR